MSTNSRRQAYTAGEKLAVVKYAEAHGNRAASRHFDGINEANIRLWRKQKERLQQMPRTKSANRGRQSAYPELEAKLLEWITDRRQQGIGISVIEVRLKAKQLAGEMAQASSFKASYGWARRFMERNDLSVRRRTTLAQRIPDDHASKVAEFQQFVIRLRRQHSYDLSLIGNADQTPLTFDLPYERSVDMKGVKTVSIRTTGHEKSHFTVMLACTADGGKLPPYVIFKRKTLPKGVQFPRGIHVRVHAKGWMDEALTLDWIKTVWSRRPGGLLKKKSMLVLDSFRCHRMPTIKAQLKQERTDLVIIPGGLTRLLQPLDVAVNKPMKDALRQRWNQWLTSDSHSFTAGGRMRQPTLVEVVCWIHSVWQELDPAIIQRGFLKCSISNALDGTEDDAVWTDLSAQSAAEDDEDDDGDIYYDGAEDAVTIDDVQRILESDSEEEFLGFE